MEQAPIERLRRVAALLVAAAERLPDEKVNAIAEHLLQGLAIADSLAIADKPAGKTKPVGWG